MQGSIFFSHYLQHKLKNKNQHEDQNIKQNLNLTDGFNSRHEYQKLYAGDTWRWTDTSA